jgi:glycosyltransferase involved in cell wall biosynthesis
MTATARERLPISAVVITRDAARGIAATLASVSFCAELLVLDSGSNDATADIARAAGARVEGQPFLGYGPQKRRAVELATHDWILSLDADEVLDNAAARAIAHVDFDDPARCWSLQRRTFIGRREVRHGPWGGERVLRLFNRATAGFTTHAVHEEVRSSRPPQPLPGSILHHSFDDTAAVLLRSIRYARLKAGVMRGKGQRANAWTMPWRGMTAFAKAYLLRGGWRDGPDGFVIALSRVIDSTLPRAMLLLGEDDDVAVQRAGFGTAEVDSQRNFLR